MDERNNNSQKYDAFISYTHKDLDVFVAETIHKKLERYHIPKKLRNKSGERRFSRIFRDKEELAVSPDLSENICRALENSEYLIVLCSPEAKESVWVQREIEYFLEYHERDHILPVLLKGEPSEAYPQNLCEQKTVETDENGRKTVSTVILEPLAADVRGRNKKEIFRKCGTEILRLIAVMLDCSYDTLRQRHREYIMKRGMMALSFALALSIGFAAFAVNQGNQINQQYQRAQINQARYLAEKANQQLDAGNRTGALETVLEVAPEDKDAAEAVVPEQMYVLNRALYAYQHSQQYIYRPNVMNTLEGVSTESNGFSQDGDIFFSLDDLGNVYFYDTERYDLLWKTAAQSLNAEETDYFLWGYFLDQDRVVLASPDTFYVLNVKDRNCEQMIASENMKNYVEQPAAVYKNILAVSYETEGSIRLYDLEQGSAASAFTCSEMEDSAAEMENTVSSLRFSEDGRRLAVGMERSAWSMSDVQYDNLFVFDCATGEQIASFYENSIVQLEFVGTDKLALITYNIPENTAFDIMHYEYEYENKVLDISTSETMWNSEKYRYSSQFDNIDKGIENIGSFSVNGEMLPVVVFYNKSSLEAVDINNWDTFYQQVFDSDIKEIVKVNDSNLLIGMSDGTVYRSMLASYSTAITVDGEVREIYYDTNTDTLVQIMYHDIIFSERPADENMTYYGTELPEEVPDTPDESAEAEENGVITGEKYTARIVNRDIVITSVETQEVLTKIPVSNEDALFDFITEEERLLVYDYALNRIVIWDIENSKILADQTFELESFFKNQLVIDEKNKRFALNLYAGSVVTTENGLQFRCLDIFTWDNNFQIYHFASVPYGDVDFENDIIYCSTTEDGEQACYTVPIYDYSELRKRAEDIVNASAKERKETK